MLLFGGVGWYDEFVVIEACLVFGGRRIVFILDLLVCRSLMRAGFSIFLCRILLRWVFFGAIRVVLFPVPESLFLLWRDLERRR